MPRQRTVYPTGEIAHLWAHQTRPMARNPQGNFSFDGPKLKSYWATIGRILTRKGKTIYALSTDRYSVTTSGHQSSARAAVPDKEARILVNMDFAHFDTATPEEIIAAKIADAAKYREKAENPRCKAFTRQYSARAYADELTATVKAAKLLGVKIPAKWAREAEKYRKSIPAYNLAIAKERKRQEELAATHNDRMRAKFDEMTAELAEKGVDQIAAAEVEKWRNGGPRWSWNTARPIVGYHLDTDWRGKLHIEADYLSLCDSRQGGHLLRINPDNPEEVETTGGVTFPLDHARKVWPILKALHTAGKTYQSNGHTIHLGHYSLDRLTEDGTIHAGCHRVTWAEAERLATAQGWN